MLVIILLILCLTSADTKNATFLLTVGNDSSQIMLAVDQTLKELNDNSLTSATIDKECNVTQALKAFHDYVTTDSSIVAVIGCGCTPVTEAIAIISWLWNLPVISCISSTLVLSDRSMHPKFFQTVPSDEMLVSALATVMNYSEWRQLTIITEEQPRFLELEYRISKMIQNSVNISKGVHFHSEIISDNYTLMAEKISHVFNYQPHIFLPLASEKAVVYILCSAYHKGRFYPNYAWILIGQQKTDWWKKHYKETNCSAAELEKVLNRSLVLIPYPDYHQCNYTDQIEMGNLYNVSAYASDAVRALGKVLETCNSTGVGLNNSCTGNNSNWNITFIGSTGIVRFNLTNGDRDATTDDHKELQSIGLIQKCDKLQLIGNSSIWPDGRPPDGTPHVVLHSLNIGTTVLNFTLGGTILMSVIVCLLFNIVFRERKIVKLISPKLNYVLLLGVTLMSLSTLAYPSTIFYLIATICTTDRLPVFASLGYDLVIGTALVKTCRVYYIFKTTSPVKKPPKDWQLLLIIILIAVIELSFAVPLLALGLVNGDVAVSRSDRMSAFNDQGVLENYFAINCGLSIYLPVFLFVSISYKFILHIFALVFAVLSRKVKIEVLNDSHETAAIIYASTVLLIITCFVMFALGETVNLLNIMWTLIIFSVSMVHLGLTFIPKMIALYKDPQGTKVFNRKADTITTPSTARSNLSSSSLISSNNEVNILQEKISQMEKRLQQYEEIELEKK